MAVRKAGLGKGLDSLIPEHSERRKAEKTEKKAKKQEAKALKAKLKMSFF